MSPVERGAELSWDAHWFRSMQKPRSLPANSSRNSFYMCSSTNPEQLRWGWWICCFSRLCWCYSINYRGIKPEMKTRLYQVNRGLELLQEKEARVCQESRDLQSCYLQLSLLSASSILGSDEKVINIREIPPLHFQKAWGHFSSAQMPFIWCISSKTATWLWIQNPRILQHALFFHFILVGKSQCCQQLRKFGLSSIIFEVQTSVSCRTESRSDVCIFRWGKLQTSKVRY